MQRNGLAASSLDEIVIPFRRFLWNAFQVVLVVSVVQPKSRNITFIPLEVIHQGPVKVTLQLESIPINKKKSAIRNLTQAIRSTMKLAFQFPHFMLESYYMNGNCFPNN